jgi:quercetin dioxygenase-like cupin family protein
LSLLGVEEQTKGNAMHIRSLLGILLVAAAPLAHASEKKELFKDGRSWDGAPLAYPAGTAEASGYRVALAPSEALPFHCHPVPTFGYLLSGALDVETLGGKRKAFRAGDAVVEVANTWHRGTNPSATEEAAFVVFYAGAEGVPTTILYNEENKGKCKE